MTTEALKELIRGIRETGAETQTIEVKSAHDGTPTRLYDSLSSFSNQDDGGIILFGLDEKNGFAPVGVYDAQDLQKHVAEQCKEMEPPVRPLFSILQEGELVFLSAEIPAVDISERPCHYKGKGRLKGSYVRVGEADELMTEYEIYSYEAFRKKYQDDVRPVTRVSLSALDQNQLAAYLLSVKVEKPNLSALSDDQIIDLMSVMRDGRATMWATLLFSPFPQAYFPQLGIIATVVPGLGLGDTSALGERYLDNKRIEGNIPAMLDEGLNFVRANMRVKTMIDGVTGKRFDKPSYPMTAVREVLLNALVHRDYSIHTEGMPIQLIMYSNRMEVINPGGLYGRMRIDQIGKVQPDTRNPVLATSLEVLRITENRYSGIPTIRREMQAAESPAPVFEDKRGMFKVTLFQADDRVVTQQQETLLDFCKIARSRTEIADFLQIKSQSYAIKTYVQPLIDSGHIRLLYPQTPSSSKQRYQTTKL